MSHGFRPRWILSVAALLSLVAPAALRAQDTTAAKAKPHVDESTPCCGVVKVDARTGLVTAREAASGYTFQFKVSNRRLLASIKVGLKVWADFAAKKVWVNARGLVKPDDSCCSILPFPAAPNPEAASDRVPVMATLER